MTSEIEIVSLNNFEKIQNFFNDSAYKEIIENSETYNTRLCIERRLRMPFLDPQTGVAQTHCALFMKKKQRMPGFRDGQIYTYPSMRWRKPKRQYLLNHHHSYRAYQYQPHHHHQTSNTTMTRDHHQIESAAIAAADGNSMSASGDNDSKDSHANAEKEWFHEDMELSHYHHVDDFEDDFESDNDFDESYSSRGKRKRGSRSRRSNINTEGTPKRGRKGGSRRRGGGGDGEITDGRRRRGGGNSGAAASAAAAAAAAAAASAAASSIGGSNSNSASPIGINDETSQSALIMPTTNMNNILHDSNGNKTSINDTTSNDGMMLTQNISSILGNNGNNSNNGGITNTSGSNGGGGCGNGSGGGGGGGGGGGSSGGGCGSGSSGVASPVSMLTNVASPKKDGKNKLRPDREIAQPSPYCDFCLGDQRENKKTNMPEELVSCSDCGRSGHPSCLQFTPNMIISVKRYRWQCIECKYCSICGTSDNDDQLLFCDDCDRGYHMYCLSPPLITPPEGSWSCKLCMDEFHKT